MKKIILFSVIFVLSFLVSQTLVSNSYSAQADYYLQLDSIRGSAVVNGEDGWLELISVQTTGDPDFDLKSYSQTSNNGTDALTDGLLILRAVDKSSPVILDALASGTHIPKGKLAFCQAGKCDTIPLSDISFLNYTMSSSQDSVIETILLSFNSKSNANTLVIPGWIKNNAKWFGEGTIGPSDFSKGIEFMIKEKIINIPDLPASSSGAPETKMPDWIKNNAKWWADGQIPDQDFVKGIQFLVEKGIIKVN